MLASCSDYLDVSSPSNTDDAFVTSSESEAFKILSTAYANYRQNAVMGIYNWNDPIRSDIEYYPEQNSSNNNNARLQPEVMICDAVAGGFNGLYNVLAYASKLASILSSKAEYQDAIQAGQTNGWTQLYGEAIALRALCYHDLTRHFGDVPYAYENTAPLDYTITSRYAICDDLIAQLKAVEPYMYKLGEGDINGERLSRTFVCGLIGRIAADCAGYQTIRTDIEGLYGDMTFEYKAKDEAHKAAYARPANYQSYLAIAKEYLTLAVTTNAGSAKLVTVDERGYNNPFQRHFQYTMDLEVSPETIFEVGVAQGPSGTGMAMNGEYGYGFGRGSSGGSPGTPNKVFAAIRIAPTHYWGGFDPNDQRRDVTAVVTGFPGKGDEAVIPFTPNSKASGGGVCSNKWDICRQDPYYTGKQRMAGMNWPIMRMGEVVLMLAQVKAELGESDALNYVNQIRQRAKMPTLSGLTGEALKNAVIDEASYELAGEGFYTWFLVRSGKFAERARETKNTYDAMVTALNGQGYYEFANGNQFPAYIWTKQMPGKATMTYECTDENDPVLFPGWRGVLDFTDYGMSVSATAYNTAIKGLFKFIPEGSEEANQLVADGYKKFAYGSDFAANIATWQDNMLPGITSENSVPLYLWPIPVETISQSNGKVNNGYGLPQQ